MSLFPHPQPPTSHEAEMGEYSAAEDTGEATHNNVSLHKRDKMGWELTSSSQKILYQGNEREFSPWSDLPQDDNPAIPSFSCAEWPQPMTTNHNEDVNEQPQLTSVRQPSNVDERNQNVHVYHSMFFSLLQVPDKALNGNLLWYPFLPLQMSHPRAHQEI